uniref:HORMA domain-containing protein n=1 Tax=Canis lupus dingo TaxID=286419 RepID=A0A8C0K482_CANLU
VAPQLSREQRRKSWPSSSVSPPSPFGINSILYQRGIYPSETSTRGQKYGLTLLITTDPELINNSIIEMSQKAIQDEILSIIRQITVTVTFLPLLEVSCSFDLLIYTDKDLVVLEKWEESGPQFVTNSEEVRLRSFSTTIHKVNSMVAYKIPTSD